MICFYFRSEICEWTEITRNLSKICSALIEAHQNSDSPGNLILECAHIDNILSRTFKAIDQKPFYADNVGFYMCASIKPIVKFVVVTMASYFNFYYDGTHKFLRGLDYIKQNVKYLSRPKKRAERCIHVFSKSTPEFNRVRTLSILK
jgi:hypothetical protein